MDPYPEKDLQDGLSPRDGQAEAPDVLDIFRHAWPVIWERPWQAALFVLALAAAEAVADTAAARLLEPFVPAIKEFMVKGPENAEAMAGMNAAAAAHGGWRLALGAFLPFFAMPFVSFALCRAALSLWDGYAPRARDLALAAACYLKALVVFLFLSVYG
ncbi:MAG: hypothetical protein LBQ12_16050, partial [Deltaproteobacteria bacterium]|nr:hypothetical protein [Deltaproteobacteria bacterium]